MDGYNPANESTSYFLDHVSKSLDKTMANYDNILIIGDLNPTMSDGPMKNFCEIYNLENLINLTIPVLLTNSVRIVFKILWQLQLDQVTIIKW